MSAPTCIDLVHLGLEGAIACYLIDAEEPTIVDPGPTTTLERLAEQLRGHGIDRDGLRHIVLTHVHLDHAGATAGVCELFPKATVHVHEDGAEHMADPERLVASTRRTFGDAHDRLWGEMKPVPASRIQAWREGDAGPWSSLRPVPTPGHIAHHPAFLDERDGTLYAGASMGIVLAGGPTHTATPPPSVDLRAWSDTLTEIAAIGPERFGVTHFGIHEEVAKRCAQLRERLSALEARVRAALARGDEDDAERFSEEVRQELAPHMGADNVKRYFDMFPGSIDWTGVAFYLKRNP